MGFRHDRVPAVTGRTPLMILGTHVFAEEVDDLVDDMPGWTVTGFVENLDRARCDLMLHDKPVRWVDELADIVPPPHLFCAIGTTQRLRFIDEVARFGLPFAMLIHPTAHVSRRSRIGSGSLVGAGTIVAAHAEIGAHVILNRGVLVGHHTTIGDCVTVSPGANIAGRVRIGGQAYIAMGAIVLDGISIGRNAVVAAGSIVTRDVPDHVMVRGAPARIVETGIEGR